MRWRRRLAEELAARPLDDIWMIVGAAVAMALGLWLFLLAVTPGLRRLLPMRQPTGIRTGEVRAGLDRRAAALVLRDRAMQVPGVQWARVAGVDSDMGDPSPKRIQHVRQGGEFVRQVT